MTNPPFPFRESRTYRVFVGCGNIYVNIELDEEGNPHKVRMQRTSKTHCSPTTLDSLFRSCTFETRRDIRQAIKDHKAKSDINSPVGVEVCDKFNIGVKSKIKQGEMAAYSCSDAIAVVLERVLSDDKKKEKVEQRAEQTV
jgi:hypothetical protein